MLRSRLGWQACATAAVVTLAGLLLQAGCSDLGDPLPVVRPLSCELRPATLDFGAVAVGDSSDRSFVVLNRGATALSAQIAVSCPDYALVAGGGAQTIPPGDSLTVTVRFRPSSAGPSSCTILTGLDCAEVVASANGAPATVSFAADIQPIFTANCVVCHGPTVANAGMNLSAATSYANLVNVVSTGYPPTLRVAPGDTTASVLFHKVFGTGVYGPSMPFGGPLLPLSQRDQIRTWIVEGARNN